MPAPTLLLVGGFLGAGKTTLLLRAARILRDRGVRAGVILNDQGGELVDTRLASAAGLEHQEVTGGCFCCRFSDFLRAAGALAERQPEVILAEPVGSCVDLSATILQPLKAYHAGQYRLAPLTALVDPGRAADLLAGGTDSEMGYLFRNQILEADLVYWSKADLFSEFPRLPRPADGRLSAETGEGVAEWLDLVLGESAAGTRVLDIDYARYAEAEAALGWVNYSAGLKLRKPRTPAAVAGPILESLDRRLSMEGAAIAHLKVLAEAATGWVRASICRNGSQPWVEGALDAAPSTRHELLVNLRAVAAPESLEAAVREALAGFRGQVAHRHCQAFRPAAPVPQHRMPEIV